MLDLARTARAFLKEKHSAFQKLREERMELLTEETEENIILKDEILTETNKFQLDS